MSEFQNMLEEDARRSDPRAVMASVVAAANGDDQEDRTEMQPLASAQALIREVVSEKPDIRLTHALEFLAHFMAAEAREDSQETTPPATGK